MKLGMGTATTPEGRQVRELHHTFSAAAEGHNVTIVALAGACLLAEAAANGGFTRAMLHTMVDAACEVGVVGAPSAD